MDKEDLQIILKEGEGYKVEFKESQASFDKDLVAFANSSGGKVIFGVTDGGVVKGIEINNKIRTQIQDIANNCRPKIKLDVEELENVLIVSVSEGDDKPYECSSGFYKRIGPISQKMTRDEIIDLLKSEGKVKFDELIEPKFNFPEDFDEARFQRFCRLAGISEIDDTEKLLISLGVAEKQEGRLFLNKAGVLFFAKEPQRFVRWSVFTVALFKDQAGVDIIDRKEIEGSLFEIVEEVMKFIQLYSKVAYRFTGMPQRENVYEYPFNAIREAVINSVMHKYYFEHGHNNILRFLPDKIRIENYWSRPSGFILGKTVFRRNQLIADLFARIHFGEKMGTGFERIKEVCNKEKTPFPEIDLDNNYFYVTFKPSIEYMELAGEATQKIPRKYPENITENQLKILELLGQDNRLTIAKLAKELGVSPETVKKNIAKLKQEGLISRIGPDKGGYWKVLE